MCGNRSVSRTPYKKTKKGCKPLTIQTIVTGVRRDAKLNDILAMIFTTSFTPFIPRTATLFVFRTVRNCWLNGHFVWVFDVF